MIQTYSPHFSYSIYIRVGQGALEIGAPSGCYSTGQQKKVKGHKDLQMQERKKIVVSHRTKKLLQLKVEHQETLQGLQVPKTCSLAHYKNNSHKGVIFLWELPNQPTEYGLQFGIGITPWGSSKGP